MLIIRISCLARGYRPEVARDVGARLAEGEVDAGHCFFFGAFLTLVVRSPETGFSKCSTLRASLFGRAQKQSRLEPSECS